jgi:exodeoxyribonuclease VII small subunit
MPEPTEFSLEDKLSALRKLVEQMQKGVSDFDQQVLLFRQGQALVEECRAYLDDAELQVQQLIDGSYQDMPPIEGD